MKIWFDLSNSPHVNLFYGLIRELELRGQQIIITTRPLANTISLLDQKKLNYTIVGDHYGKNLFLKIIAFPLRILQLYFFLRNKKIDVAVSQSSFHSPLVAKMLFIPSLYTNDNEHAIGNIPAFLFASKILIPEFYPLKNIKRLGISEKKIQKYPGVKEGIFLWNSIPISNNTSYGKIKKSTIYIRPEPLTAQYYKGAQYFLDSLIENIQHKYSVTILSRNNQQYKHYIQPRFSKTFVPSEPLPFNSIAENCALFIGAGGSMTREFAIVGIPTISVYQDKLLDVDKYLISKGIMMYLPELSAEKLDECFDHFQTAPPESELLKKGKQAYLQFRQEILNFEKKPPTVFIRKSFSLNTSMNFN